MKLPKYDLCREDRGDDLCKDILDGAEASYARRLIDAGFSKDVVFCRLLEMGSEEIRNEAFRRFTGGLMNRLYGDHERLEECQEGKLSCSPEEILRLKQEIIGDERTLCRWRAIFFPERN